MTKNSTCTEKKLENFGKKHFTYINQMFGDSGVRSIIAEVYPNSCYEFNVEKASSGFEHNTEHHNIYDKNKKKIICSTKMKCNGKICQDIRRDVNDTLCQSYSLLIYFDKKMPKTRRDRQMAMIQLYREILDNKTFVNKLDDEILSNNDNEGLWSDFTKDREGTVSLNMDKQTVMRNLRDVLNKWEEYGYMYFMGKGHCQ
jgi:hypothetical protein